ncbi:hypothetical protein ACFL3S_03650 [Gemmatimonadota bacterium]
MPSPSLLQRLKERKLVHWALAYLAGAFVVFQGVEVMAEPWSISPALQRAIHILLLIGLCVTLVLAWYHGEMGRQRVSGPELLMVAALLVVAGVALSTLGPGDEASSPGETATAAVEEDDRPSIAVLPFDDFSPNPDGAYFANGMHEEIISKLLKIAALRVISRNSVMQYREERKPTPQIAAELGVDFLLQGSARIAGDQVRLTAQLIDARRDEHLWQDDYDQGLSVENLISTQSDIAQQVAHAVGASLTGDEQARIEAVPTENLQAYEAYMIGRYHLERRDDLDGAFSEAVRYFRLAIQQDSELAVAHSGLAGAYALIAMLGVSDPREMWPQVERWARSALAIDRTDALAHRMLAYSGWSRTWDWEEGERGLRRAIELSPSDPNGHVAYADFLMAQGRIDEGSEEGKIAAALDPLSSHTLSSQARWVFLSRRYEEADQLAEAFFARDPDNITAMWFLGASFVLGGHPEKVPRLSQHLSADPTRMTPAIRAASSIYLSLIGEADSARVELDHAMASSGDRYLEPGYVWPAYAALGDLDAAFRWMERGIEVQAWSAAFLGVTPLADPLRDDPRYQAILDRIGLGHLRARFDSLAAADPRGGT